MTTKTIARRQGVSRQTAQRSQKAAAKKRATAGLSPIITEKSGGVLFANAVRGAERLRIMAGLLPSQRAS
jgi:predicted DNA-binding protein (UPF0251 family)